MGKWRGRPWAGQADSKSLQDIEDKDGFREDGGFDRIGHGRETAHKIARKYRISRKGKKKTESLTTAPPALFAANGLHKGWMRNGAIAMFSNYLPDIILLLSYHDRQKLSVEAVVFGIGLGRRAPE
jgi:hypothetical protein